MCAGRTVVGSHLISAEKLKEGAKCGALEVVFVHAMRVLAIHDKAYSVLHKRG